jgi:hypothetical protein
MALLEALEMTLAVVLVLEIAADSALVGAYLALLEVSGEFENLGLRAFALA